jgi:hypothetical protein
MIYVSQKSLRVLGLGVTPSNPQLFTYLEKIVFLFFCRGGEGFCFMLCFEKQRKEPKMLETAKCLTAFICLLEQQTKEKLRNLTSVHHLGYPI